MISLLNVSHTESYCSIFVYYILCVYLLFFFCFFNAVVKYTQTNWHSVFMLTGPVHFLPLLRHNRWLYHSNFLKLNFVSFCVPCSPLQALRRVIPRDSTSWRGCWTLSNRSVTCYLQYVFFMWDATQTLFQNLQGLALCPPLPPPWFSTFYQH